MDLGDVYDEFEDEYDEEDDNYNDGIYIDRENLPVMRLKAPINAEHCGIYGRSFAYYSLKERFPVILTKIIDYLAREGQNIMSKYKASQDDINNVMQTVTKLKSDLMTNKEYDPFTYEGCVKWNRWIEALDNKKYFLNSWMFTECYVYRKIRESCEIAVSLTEFDYFEDQKNKSFQNNEELMCIVADRVVDMVKPSEKDKRKADFVTLLKICLWANKCDLSLSLGNQVDMIQAAKDETERLRLNPPPPPPPAKGKKKKPSGPPGPITISPDPFQMITDLKDKVIADDCNKIADQVQKKAEKMLENITAAKEALVFKAQCSCNRMAKAAGLPVCTPPPPPEGEAPGSGSKPGSKAGSKPGTGDNSINKIPCPAKITIPSAVFFDIITDNAGYELFADLCLAHFLVGQKIIQKVRFHVKNMPWFVSDVTVKDFNYLIDACIKSQFSGTSSTGATEGENNEPKIVTADNLRALGEQWKKYVDDGIFIILADEFWTYPHCYKEMKKHDPHLYRKLQTGVASLFKGDLNYRKLVGDVNCNPSMNFQAAIGEFKPSSVIAVRVVKAETVAGLGRGKFDAISKINPEWMRTGNYGVIQFAAKGEPLKISNLPCIDYCTTCFGVICPEHFDM